MNDALRGLAVGRLPYLNALPFHAGWPIAEPGWVAAPPRRLGELAAAGLLDAALLASRDTLRLADRFRPLADLGIASRGAVGSVLLFSKVPVEQLEGRTVAITEESCTSRGLLWILFAERLRIRVASFTDRFERADAILLIGDNALLARGAPGWPYVLDLGEAWTKWTDLPFVWARWSVRRDLPEAVADALAAALAGSLAAPRRLAAAPRPGLTSAEAGEYLDRFRYRLGTAEAAGLERFRQELERHDLLRRDS